MQPARDISGYRKHWAARFGTAPFLPMSRAEMDALGWDSCDVIIVTGDAYVDHPSFGMAIVGPRARGAGLPRRHHRAAGLAQRRAVRSARPPEPVLRHHRRQHGFDGEPLHLRPAHAQRRRVHAGRRGRQAAGSLASSSTRSARAKRSGTCRSSSAASRPRCGASRTSTTGRRKCAARCCSMRRRTCWCTATPSGRSCEIAHRLAAGETHRATSPTCAARRSRARRCPRAGSRSTRRISMRPGR